MSLRPGDIVTEEPTKVGTVLSDRDDDRWTKCLDGDEGWWSSPGLDNRRWDSLNKAYGPLTLVSTPPSEPAEEWEPVTADQVRVGDQIEVTHENPGEESSAVFRGPVTYRAENGRVLHIGIWQVTCTADSDLIPSVTIRRRVRAPMPEPDAPAVVRHAGFLFARSVHDADPNHWEAMDGKPIDDDRFLEWAQVLALDPSTDPVPVDLGGGA